MQSIETIAMPTVTSAQDGVRQLLAEMSDWLTEALDRHLALPWQGGHDEGTFATSWAQYYDLTGDERVMRLARALRDGAVEWGKTNFTHGYHRRQEAHHGPEHWAIFLAWVHRLDPQDEKTNDAILDAAHHIGNWVEGVPRWYRWEVRRFVSTHLGTEHVGDDRTNIAEHLRFVRIALLAYAITRGAQYLAFAREYAGEWAAAITASPEIPVHLDSGDEARAKFESARKQFLGAAPRTYEALARHESHIASGTPALFMRLWKMTGDERCGEAAKRLILPLVDELRDPYGHPTGVLFSKYRERVADRSLDDRIVAAIGAPPALDDRGVRTLGIATHVEWGRLVGIGKRIDMPAWHFVGTDGEEHACDWPSPAALMLACEVTGDKAYAAAASTLALARLRLARRVYPDGREHGCGSRTIAAVCRGHGRNWGAGNVSGVLGSPVARRLAAGS